jgi:hypothetical protein
LRRGRCLADFWDASVALMLEMLVNSPAAQLHNNTTLCICICITPCHLFNDVLLQRDKSRRRSVENICPILQSSRKRNLLAGHPPSSVSRAQHVQKEQRELGSYNFQEVLCFLVAEFPHVSFSFATDIGRLEKSHTLRIKCCSWSTRSCNHERPRRAS